MPNWVSNVVTVEHDNYEKIEEIRKIFESENPFSSLIAEPDWKNTPDENGELPTLEVIESDGFRSEYLTLNGTQDMRWYDWRVNNWGTKWDINGDEVGVHRLGDASKLLLVFDTAWSFPDPIYKHLAQLGYKLTVEWEDDCMGERGKYSY